ncbi:MAG: helix-turn-helix transcriptional regulator [Gemmatimonadales bacterium]
MDDENVVPIEVEEERALLFLRKVVTEAYARNGRRRRYVREANNRNAADYADRVSEVVAARYREPLSLAEVGRAVDCSPFHLTRLVTAVTGLSIHRMIVRRRLRDAVEWLLKTRESVSFIAHAVGFGSHSRLTEAFRREYGMPPSTVRQTFTARCAGAALRDAPRPARCRPPGTP